MVDSPNNEVVALNKPSSTFYTTEAGVIPSDWKVESFKNVTALITCGIAATPMYVAKHSGVPFLSSTNVKNGSISFKEHKYISQKLHDYLYRNNPPRKGDILYSRVGTIGEAAVIEVDFEFSIYVSLTLIKPAKVLDPYYLAQLLNSPAYRKRANNTVYLGGGVGNLNVSVVRDFPIVIPPTLTEQRAIARALSDTDALLAALDALIAKKEAIKRGALEELLSGERRLGGFNGEWENYRISECFDILKTASFSRRQMQSNEGVGCVHYGDVHTILPTHFDGRKYSLPKVTVDQAAGYPKIEDGDLIFSDASEDFDGIGMTVEFANMSDMEAIGGLHTYLLRPNPNILAKGYPGYLTKIPIVKEQLVQKSTGTTVYGISKQNLSDVVVQLPAIQEQEAITMVLVTMDAELSSLRARREKLARVKAGMMEELLTGRVRLV